MKTTPKPTLDRPCDECNNIIPHTEPSMVNAYHHEACSLHPDRVVDEPTRYTADDLPRQTHVMTPHGPGRVGYVRLASPDYHYVEAVMVRLGSKNGQPAYEGSMYAVADITKI